MTPKLALPLVLTACAAALGCRSAPSVPPATGEPEMLLRSYAVPAGGAQQVGTVLAQLLNRPGGSIGMARPLPGDRIAVLAPAGVQEGVASLLDGLVVARGDLPDTFEMSYWLVTGRPASAGTRGEELGGLDEPLDAIEEAQGAMSFELLERFRVVSVNGERAVLQGRSAHVTQVASAKGGSVVAEVEINLSRNDVKATVQAPPGRFVVLAEVGLGSEPSTGLYVILRSALKG